MMSTSDLGTLVRAALVAAWLTVTLAGCAAGGPSEADLYATTPQDGDLLRQSERHRRHVIEGLPDEETVELRYQQRLRVELTRRAAEQGMEVSRQEDAARLRRQGELRDAHHRAWDSTLTWRDLRRAEELARYAEQQREYNEWRQREWNQYQRSQEAARRDQEARQEARRANERRYRELLQREWQTAAGGVSPEGESSGR
jgi:hypothetical protein